MRIGVTGPNGRLASWLIAHHGCIPLECDITKFDETRIEFQRVSPDVVINAAAYTKVDRAEKEQQKALLVNVRGAGNVRMAFSGPLVHLSTSYVFSGAKDAPYTEVDPPAPINEYGWSKWGSEASILSGGSDNCLVVRTISLYGGSSKPDFVSSVLSGLSLHRAVVLPDKLISNPIYLPHLAEALMWCIRQGVRGTINIAGTDIVSRFTWAKLIAEEFGFDPTLIRATAVAKGAADRPKNQALDLSMAESIGTPLYSLRRGLKELKQWDAQKSTSHP